MIEILRDTLIIDIDGTIVHTVTEKDLPFAVKKINKAYDDGTMIVLITFRGDNWEFASRFSKLNTLALLEKLGLKSHAIVWDSPSPRTVINDDGAKAVEHLQNGSWEHHEFV